MRFIRSGLIVLTAALVTGCATDFPQVDAAFGKSLTRMVAAQTKDPHAAAHPRALAPAIADGQRMENVLQAHRKDIPAGSQQVAKTPQFDVGGQDQ